MTAFKSGNEKKLMDRFEMPDELFPYPIKTIESNILGTVSYYDIPDSDKGKILKIMYPFWPIPRMNDYYLDIHENKKFRVSDYMLIREDSKNYVVSPYYPHSGGMAVDWMELSRARVFNIAELSKKYGSETISSERGEMVEVYNIPDTERIPLVKEILKEYCRFSEDGLFYDCLAQKCFKWQDFLIDADDESDGLVSPLFSESSSIYRNCLPVPPEFCNAETLKVDNSEANSRVLPYNLKILTNDSMRRHNEDLVEYFSYDIPESDKRSVFEALFPFRPIPDFDSEVTDACVQSKFKLKDYIVIRDQSTNIILTPFFNEIGNICL